MNSFKDKVVREIIRLGKKKHSLRMPALALTALFLVTYHSVRNFFLQFRYHPVRQRILVGILILSLLAGQIGIINVFAESEGGDTEYRTISAFLELPDDVREQSVPVGTALEELTLPDTLEAYVTVEAEDGAEDDRKPDDGDQNKDDDEKPDDSGQDKGDQEKPDENDGENGDGEEKPDDDDENGDEDDGKENSGDGDENGGEGKGENDGEVTPGDNGGENEADSEEEPAEENDTDTQSIGTDVSTDTDSAANTKSAGFGIQTGSFVMPEYQAENVITVNQLEDSSAENAKTENTENSKTDDTETVTITGITWQSEPEYDGDTEGVYIFTAVLPEGYTMAEGVSLPEITVTVEDGDTALIQALLDRIAALPELEEYLASEPDMEEDEEAYAQWEEKLYEYAEEALDIWEEYEALTEEQQAQIPAEMFHKLTAWVELAEQIAGNTMMMAAAHTHNDITFEAWESSNSLPSTAGNYYLTKDVTTTNTWTINNMDVKLCLNGHQITCSGSTNTTACVTIDNGGSLSVYDCQNTGSLSLVNKYSRNMSSAAGVYVGNNGTFSLYSGSITAKTDEPSDRAFSGLYNNGTIYLNGGSITATASQQSAIAVSNCKEGHIYGGTYVANGKEGGANYGLYTVGTTYLTGNPSFSPGSVWRNLQGLVVAKEDPLTYTGSKLTVFVDSPYCGLVVGGLDAGTKPKFEVKSLSENYKVIKYPVIDGVEYIIVEGANTVSYDANGGAGEMTPQTFYMYGDDAQLTTAILQENVYTKSGYVFGGWNTSSDGTGTAYTDQADFTAKLFMWENSTTLYAHWTPNTYTVTLDGNGGSGGTNLTSYTYGTGAELPANWTKTGYTFGGWYENSDLSGTAVTSIFGTTTGNKTYYAKWTADSYNIAYKDKNNATFSGTHGSDYPTKHTYGTATTLVSPTKTGYTFGGWYTDSGCANNKVTSLAADSYTADITLYAKWTAKEYTITYKDEGNKTFSGSHGSGYPIKHTYGTATTLVSPTKTGYTFGGWYTDSNCTGSPVTSLAADSYTAGITLYAKWTAEQYKVTFDYQGATGGNSTAEKTVTYDSAYGTLPAPTRTGYTFKGWYKQAGGQGGQVTAQTTVATANAHTLFAYWKDETPPDAPILQDGVTLPTGWTSTQASIPLKLYDGVGVTELWIKADGGAYAKVDSFSSGSTTYSYAVGDGEHTYQFMAKDAAGNGSADSAVYTVKLDKTPPVIDLADMTVENGAKNLWNWIIGKKSMIIKIPEGDITDALSGIAEVTYTATPDSGTEQTETIRAKGGYYEIALNAEFTGTIKLTAKDNAGNTTQASLTAEGGKVIAEDYAPVVTITLPDTPTPNANGWYTTGFAITVTVTDDKDSSSAAITSGGIAGITWKDGENGAEQTVQGLPGTAPVYEKEFTIQAADGTHTYYINAVDNAGNESGWQTVTVSLDATAPAFSGNPGVTDRTQESADIAFTPSEGGKVYWIVSDAETAPSAQEVKNRSGQNGNEKDITGGVQETFTVGGFLPGTTHRVYVVLEDAAGNLSEVKDVSFTTLQAAPEITPEDLDIDHEKETIKIPDRIGEVEVYTNPADPEGSIITPNADGSLPVEPGKSIYIRYPEKTDGGETTPASGSVKIDIPDGPAPPSPKQTAVTDTTVTVTNPVTGEEYVLVEKGQTPDWSDPNTTGQFTGLDPNTEYDLYVRKKATESSFVSEPAKMEVRTSVTIKEPVITGDGAGEDGNTAPKPEAPDAGGGTVTYTGTYGEEYTPVIIVGGQEMNPGAEMTWDEGSGKGKWEYTHDIPAGAEEVEITVEFRKRAITGLAVTPDTLTIYADNAANESIDALTSYLKENSSVQAAYDNKTKGAAQADYTTTDSFVQKGAAYNYTVSAGGKTKGITLTVKPVTAAATAPDALMQRQKDGGYTEAEVSAWLPAQVTVTYTGAGYTARTERRTVTWNTGSIGTDFGAALGRKTVNGTVELPAWATGLNTVSIVIEFVDKTPLTDNQMTLSISGWAYGAQTAPNPKGSITVTDTNPVYTYLYSADNGAAWVTAQNLPKSGSGNIVPGEYQVKMIYTGDNYTGEKTASFTVTRKALEVQKGTFEAKSRFYDGTTDATLKEVGEPALSSVVEGDDVTPGGNLSAVFTKAGPGKDIPVTVTGFELKGRDAGYYELKNTTLTLYADINAAVIKEPIITGDGAGEDDNTAPKPDVPDADGRKVTFTGTYGEEYTPVIIVGGQEMNPGAEMTWDEGSGKGEWEYTHDIQAGAEEVEITVEFRKRTITGITVTPDTLTIYADNIANGSITALTSYLKENSSVQAVYDNKTKGTVQADYTTVDSFAVKGRTYSYTVIAGEETGWITLKVVPVNATLTAPAELMKTQKSDGYTAEEVTEWLPAQATVTYTGDGYTARTESRTVTWNTGSIGTDFGAEQGRKTVNGTVELPAWATGQNTVSIVIEFVDKTPLTDNQMTLSISGWAYGAQTAPNPKGSITVTDTNPTYTYLYSADNGAAWVTAESLPKSAGGHIVPGEYMVKMTYTGDNYTGEKTASFTVTRKALDLLSGTLAVNDKNYDGTTDATLKEGGQPELSGVITGDTVTPDGTLSAVFTNKGPKKNIPVTVTGFELKGREAGYYELKNTTLTLYATINNADGTPPSSGVGGGNSGGNDDGENGGGNGSDDSGDGSGDNGGSTPGDDSDPDTPAVTPPAETPPADTPQPDPVTGGTPDKETETQPTPQPEGTPENGAGSKDTDTDKPGQDSDPAQPDNKPQPENETVQTVPTSIAEGRIVADDGTGSGDGGSAGSGNPADGGKIATGNVPGMADAGTTSKTSTLLALGDGAVIVTVVCEEQKCTAGVADTIAVANAVLTPEQIQLVNEGETIEVRIDVKDISETVTGQDKEVIESGVAEYQKEIPELTLGMYVDISMFIRIGEGDWDAVTSTKEPIEVVIGIPEELMEDGREFYIIRSHEGEYTLLNDMDDAPDTITISTDMFSAYAIAYRQTDTDNMQDGNTKCGLCHICPTFLGICCFIWLAVIIAATLVIVLIVWRRQRDKDKN